MLRIPLSPSIKKGITSGQIAKFQDMVGHALRKSKVFAIMPTSDVDRFIKGANLKDAIAGLAEKQFREFLGCYILPVNYGAPEAVIRAIEEAKFDWKKVNLSPNNIPLVGAGQVVHEVYEVNFGKIIYNSDLPNALKESGKKFGFANGFKFADPLTALRYACAFPDQQRKYQIAILFNAEGHRWVLCLDESDGKRGLRVHEFSLCGYWAENIRFLAICDLSSIS
jgi:hypothetical protein